MLIGLVLVLTDVAPLLDKFSSSSFLFGNALLIGSMIWGYLLWRRSDDEVVRAANETAMSVGAPIGLGVAYLSLFGIPTVIVAFSEEKARMLATGFAFGVQFTCGLVIVFVLLTWGCWWAIKNR